MTAALALSTDLVVYSARLVRLVRHLHDIPADTRVLALLDQHGAVGITGLAKLDRCAQPTMSAAVARLVDGGLVTKEANPQDARGSVITLTPAGHTEIAARRLVYGTTILERLSASNHTEAELATTVAVLRDLLDASVDTTEGNR